MQNSLSATEHVGTGAEKRHGSENATGLKTRQSFSTVRQAAGNIRRLRLSAFIQLNTWYLQDLET